MAAYERGTAAAWEEIRQNKMTIYAQNFAGGGTDPETGLPLQTFAGCTDPLIYGDYFRGHNDTIRAYVAAERKKLPPATNPSDPEAPRFQ